MKLIKLLFVVIIALVLGSVTMSNRSVDESVVVADLEHEITLLQDQNTILQAEVAASGALSTLSARIAEAGFTESPKVAALPTPTAVALR